MNQNRKACRVVARNDAYNRWIDSSNCFGGGCFEPVNEIKRIDILLNKTREDYAKR